MRADLPVRPEVRPHDVVVAGQLGVHGQPPEVEDLAQAAADRDYPFLYKTGILVASELPDVSLVRCDVLGDKLLQRCALDVVIASCVVVVERFRKRVVR